MATSAANRPPGIDPDWTHVNAVAYNPELDQIAVSVRLQRVLDHRSRHDDGRSGRPHRRPQGQGRRPALPLGQPPRLPGRHEGGSEAVLPAQRPLDSPRASRRGTYPGLQQRRERPDGHYSSVDEIVLPVDSQGQYTRRRARPTGRTSPCGATPRPRRRTSIPPSSPAPIACPTATRSSVPAPTAPSSK